MRNYLISVSAAVFVLALIIHQVASFEDLKHVKIPLSSVLICAVLFFIIKATNTLRYGFIFKINAGGLLFFILCYANMMVSLLPFRAGEIFYATELKKKFGLAYVKSVGGLVAIRFFDYICVFLLLIFFVFYLASEIDVSISQIVIAATALLFITTLAVALVGFSAEKLLRYKKLLKAKIFISEAVQEIKRITLSDILRLGMLTIIYWLLRLGMGYVVLYSLDFSLSFALYSLISLVLLFVGLIPIKLFGDFGIFEGGWIAMLGLWGVDPARALPVIISYHLIIFLTPMLFGLIAMCLLLLHNKKIGN